ncbi:MAG: hypothetical protein QXW35_01565 [Candidatus Aenigmatarchaeota archaeon]
MSFEETKQILLSYWTNLDNLVRFYTKNPDIDYDSIAFFITTELKKMEK